MLVQQDPLTHQRIRDYASSLGADLVGFALVSEMEKQLDPPKSPSLLADDMNTVIVLGKKTLAGVSWSRHITNKQLAGGRSIRSIDRIALQLATWSEKHGHVSLPIASGAMDFETRQPEDVTPAGQGSTLLRQAAVTAGLGTWGLNNMVLTREFGPRVFFGAVLTRATFKPDRTIDEELCLGLEACGRCAAICPEDAIPRRARVGASLSECRHLDCTACARSSQPFGYTVFEEYVNDVLSTSDAKTMFDNVHVPATGVLWAEMAVIKEGVITGCNECMQVCPVGADYATFKLSPHRQEDLPETLTSKTESGHFEIEHVGPRTDRKIRWQSPSPPKS